MKLQGLSIPILYDMLVIIFYEDKTTLYDTSDKENSIEPWFGVGRSAEG